MEDSGYSHISDLYVRVLRRTLINYSGSSKSNIKVESHGFHSTLPTPGSFSPDYTTASQPNQGGEAIPLLLRCQLVRFRRLLPVLLAGEGCRAGVCPDFSALELWIEVMARWLSIWLHFSWVQAQRSLTRPDGMKQVWAGPALDPSFREPGRSTAIEPSVLDCGILPPAADGAAAQTGCSSTRTAQSTVRWR